MAQPWGRRDTVAATLLASAALLSRWALRGKTLYSYDSALLAAGIRDYGFAAFHPHPPFYPVTIGLGKLLAPAMGLAGSLVVLSVLASGAMVAATYAVGQRLAGSWVGGGAAAIVLLSPTALFNGITPLSYALEGAASAGLALLALRCRHSGRPLDAAWMGGAASVAIGLRPSSAILLAPLVVWATWRRWRPLAAAAAAGTATTLAWAIPMLVAGGGLRLFLAGLAYQSKRVVFAHTPLQDGWPAVADNLGRLASYVPVELPFFLVATLVALLALPLWWHRRGSATSFLLAWGLPSLLFYVFVYAGWPIFPSGYAMALLPPAAVAAALTLRTCALAMGREPRRSPSFARIAQLLVCALAVLPLLWPLGWAKAVEPQRRTDAWASSWRNLEASYPANETALLTFGGWGWAQFDHPQYLAWFVEPYWNQTGAVRFQVIEERNGTQDSGYFTNVLLDSPIPHPIPSWVRHIVAYNGPDDRSDLLRAGLGDPQQVAPHFDITVLDPHGLPSIEAALKWFDTEGRPLP